MGSERRVLPETQISCWSRGSTFEAAIPTKQRHRFAPWRVRSDRLPWSRCAPRLHLSCSARNGRNGHSVKGQSSACLSIPMSVCWSLCRPKAQILLSKLNTKKSIQAFYVYFYIKMSLITSLMILWRVLAGQNILCVLIFGSNAMKLVYLVYPSEPKIGIISAQTASFQWDIVWIYYKMLHLYHGCTFTMIY